ncbi:MAG: hypothetical protein HC849_07415 [Oscillatoriales cyanobacterium RU_3_3]|nr:hypothetical protein [Oscillatoriales cyanobacterium RU_3_3]
MHDRNLVLVGNENQVLDVLTPEQQQLLSGRIVWEVANSGTQRREIAQKELEFNLGVESAAVQAKLPPLKTFLGVNGLGANKSDRAEKKSVWRINSGCQTSSGKSC